MIPLKPFHWRLAELFTVLDKRPLNDQEAVEMHHCLKANTEYCWDVATLESMSLLASMTSDVEWQHQLCAKLETVMYGKKKKPGHKATD